MLKDRIGMRSSSYTVALSEERMRAFASAVKATVGNTSHSPIVSSAIPTVFTIFRDGEFELLSKLGIELKEVLHATQEYQYEGLLQPNEEIIFDTVLASVVEKKGSGSVLAFMVFETDFFKKSDSSRVAQARSTIVHRKTEISEVGE